MRFRMKLTAKAAGGLRCMATPEVSPAAAQHQSGEAWRVVLAAYFGVMVSFGSLLVFSFGTFLKPLSTEFGWTREAISAAFGIAALTVAVCSPFLGRLLNRSSDRGGPRTGLVIPSGGAQRLHIFRADFRRFFIDLSHEAEQRFVLVIQA
jgi:hypothetical protein